VGLGLNLSAPAGTPKKPPRDEKREAEKGAREVHMVSYELQIRGFICHA
jgi:hypothetical protein